MTDLNALFQNLGPTGGSLMAGIQQGQAFNANEDLSRLRAQQLEESMLANQLTRATMADKIRAAGLSNESTLANIAGQRATTAGQELKNRMGTATFDMDLEAAKGANKLKTLQNKATEQELTGEMLAQFAGTLDNLPPELRHRALFKFAETSGVPMDQHDIDHYTNVKPENLSKHLNDQAIASIKRSKTYITEMAKKDKEEATKLEAKRLEIQGRKELEQLGIDAGKYKKAERGGGVKASVAIMRQPPAGRVSAIKGILDSGVNPDTGEELTATERALYESVYNSDVEVVNAQLAARTQQGVVPTTGPGGNVQLTNRTTPTVGNPSAPRGTAENPIKLD